MSTIGFRVQDMRVVTHKTLLAFFNLAFGVEDANGDFTGLFVVRDFALKAKTDGGYWFQSPAKARVKNGQQVMENGFPKYDDYFEPFKAEGAGKDGKYGVTKAGWQFKDQIIEAASKMYDSLKGTPQGRTPVRAGVATQVQEKASGTPLDDDDDFGF